MRILFVVTQSFSPGSPDLYQLVNMLVGPREAQHWMQLGQDPEASPGALPSNLALAFEESNWVAERLWDSIPGAFPKLIDSRI